MLANPKINLYSNNLTLKVSKLTEIHFIPNYSKCISTNNMDVCAQRLLKLHCL